MSNLNIISVIFRQINTTNYDKLTQTDTFHVSNHARPPPYTPSSSFHTYLLRHLAPMISTIYLLNMLISMPITYRCHFLGFTILHLSIIKSPDTLFVLPEQVFELS